MKETHMDHIHPISHDVTTYAVHRKQGPETMDRIYSVLASRQKDPVSIVMATLKAMNITNIIKKDIRNIQMLFLRDEDSKEMYNLVVFLENQGYVVRIQADENHKIESMFVINEAAIKEAIIWSEALIIGPMYKTNAHKMTLINIVGTSNASSVKDSNRLQTYSIAPAFVKAEIIPIYT